MRILVVGLGNPVLGDDGVGWHVTEALRARWMVQEPPADVDVVDCCRGGLALMERMVGYDRAIVVDAIVTGSTPGTLHQLTPDDLPTQHSASGHDVNLATALALGRSAGVHLPAQDAVLLVGVEALDTEHFGEALTPDVAAAVPAALAAVEAATAPAPA